MSSCQSSSPCSSRPAATSRMPAHPCSDRTSARARQPASLEAARRSCSSGNRIASTRREWSISPSPPDKAQAAADCFVYRASASMPIAAPTKLISVLIASARSCSRRSSSGESGDSDTIGKYGFGPMLHVPSVGAGATLHRCFDTSARNSRVERGFPVSAIPRSAQSSKASAFPGGRLATSA